MLSTAAPPDAMHAREGGPLTRPFGLVSDGPRGIPAERLPPRRRRRHDSQLVTATEKLPVEEVARLFVRLPWRILPVVGLGRLVGVVTRSDVVHALVGSDQLASPG